MRLHTVVCVVLVASAAGCASQIVEPPQDVPAPLQVPDSQKLIVKAHASGMQVYACTAATPGQYAWTLKGPEATLSDRLGARLGRHYAGPTWKALDGSMVVGKVKAHLDSPDPAAIPWLLLDASNNSGDGLFGQVESVLRLHTQGGKAPAEGCDAGHAATEARIPYQADYYFYGPR